MAHPGKPADARPEDGLTAAIASLRDVLSKHAVITGERLQETIDETVKRGRMTRQDAEELAGNLVEIGRRQAQDALAEVEGLLGRVRRAAGLGPTFPITGYDDLTAAQVTERLADLSHAELRKVRDHERRNANRKTVLTAIEKRLA